MPVNSLVTATKLSDLPLSAVLTSVLDWTYQRSENLSIYNPAPMLSMRIYARYSNDLSQVTELAYVIVNLDRQSARFSTNFSFLESHMIFILKRDELVDRELLHNSLFEVCKTWLATNNTARYSEISVQEWASSVSALIFANARSFMKLGKDVEL